MVRHFASFAHSLFLLATIAGVWSTTASQSSASNSPTDSHVSGAEFEALLFRLRVVCTALQAHRLNHQSRFEHDLFQVQWNEGRCEEVLFSVSSLVDPFSGSAENLVRSLLERISEIDRQIAAHPAIEQDRSFLFLDASDAQRQERADRSKCRSLQQQLGIVAGVGVSWGKANPGDRLEWQLMKCETLLAAPGWALGIVPALERERERQRERERERQRER